MMVNFNVKLRELLQHFSWHSEIQGYQACPENSSHFAYLENRSLGLDITWQPFRGDFTAHPWTVTLPWG